MRHDTWIAERRCSLRGADGRPDRRPGPHCTRARNPNLRAQPQARGVAARIARVRRRVISGRGPPLRSAMARHQLRCGRAASNLIVSAAASTARSIRRLSRGATRVVVGAPSPGPALPRTSHNLNEHGARADDLLISVCAVLAKACNTGLVRRRHHDRQRARGRRARRAAAQPAWAPWNWPWQSPQSIPASTHIPPRSTLAGGVDEGCLG